MSRRNGKSQSSANEDGFSHRGVRFGPTSVDSDDEVVEAHCHILFWESIWGVVTALLAAWCMLGLMTILVVLYVTVRPFDQATYRRLAAAWGAAAFLDSVTLLLPSQSGKIYLTGDSDLPSPVGSSMLVANHVIATDWWALFLLGRCIGLRGSLKVFLRNEFLHVNMENVDLPSTTNTASTTSTTSTVTVSTTTASSTMGSNAGTGPASTSAAMGSLATTASTFATPEKKAAPDLALMAKLLHLFLEFPLINGEDSASDREQLFTLLRSFAASADTGSPVHLLLYPECWSTHNGTDRRLTLAKSNAFAKREGKPPLTHLLYPRTRGFNASLECLRESSPVVYDVTMAYSGYDGSLPSEMELSMTTLWDLLRRKFPKEVHLRIKRYSMEEVLQDSNWLFKKWAEKDRLLSYFARHQMFPNDNRGYCQHRVFHPRSFAMESSILALIRLLLLPCAVPFLLLFSLPMFWTLLTIWVGQKIYHVIYPVPSERAGSDESRSGSHSGAGERTPGSASLSGTPFFPATPFGSPTLLNWRDMFSPNGNNNGSNGGNGGS